MKWTLFVLILVCSGTPAWAQEVSFDALALQGRSNHDIPAIMKVAIAPSPTAVRIEWETDVPATSFIEYGETPAYGLRAPARDALSPAERAHRVEIVGLSEFRTYHFRIRASHAESVNELFSRALTFTTLPNGEQPPAAPLAPTPSDFSAPRALSLTHAEHDGLAEIVVTTDEASLSRFELGVYTKGTPFIFDERDAGVERETRTRFAFTGVTPGSLSLYRLTTQDRLGNRAVIYGNKQFASAVKNQGAAPQNGAPANSVLITSPTQLSGIPQADIWKDEKSGRLYRIFRTMPPGAVLLTHPSQLAGLNVFQIWKDEKSGRLYRHAGIPNPQSKESAQKNERTESKESDKNKEAQQNKESTVPKNWIRITNPIQLKVLFPHEVWRDKKTGAMYRMVGVQQASPQPSAESRASSQEGAETYIPFYR